MGDLLWPSYDGPGDLAAIEAVPLADRGLPGTTYELLVRAAGLWPDRVALSVLPDGERWEHPAERTFAELLSDVHRYANVFHALGVRRTDGVALLAPNCDELVTATLAAELAGIAAPINSGLSREHIAELLRRSGARVLVAAGPDLAPEVWESARELAVETGMDALLALNPTAAGPAEAELVPIDGVRVGHLSALAAEQPHDAFVGEAPSATDLAALFHTGGTTGTPKLAAHTHANEVSDAWMIAVTGVLRDDAVVFAALPLFHVNALLVTVLAPLFRGLHVVWAGPLGYRDQALYPQLLEGRRAVRGHHDERRAHRLLRPRRLARRRRDQQPPLRCRRCVTAAAGGPGRLRVRDRHPAGGGLRSHRGHVRQRLSFPQHPRPGSVGQRLPYQQVKAVQVTADGEWVDLPAGQVGVLAISGPTVFPGYVTDRGPDGPVLDGLGKLRDGWLETGDLARVDADGFVHLTGRAKDLIIRGGHNIDPAVIESVLLAHPAVTAAQAVGRPDVHAGEVPVAFVTLAPGAAPPPRSCVPGRPPTCSSRPRPPRPSPCWTHSPSPPSASRSSPPCAQRPPARPSPMRSRDMSTVTGVRAELEGGAVVAVIGLAPGADETSVKEVLNSFAINWRLEHS